MKNSGNNGLKSNGRLKDTFLLNICMKFSAVLSPSRTVFVFAFASCATLDRKRSLADAALTSSAGILSRLLLTE